MPWKGTEKVPISFWCSGILEEALSSKIIKKYLYLVFLHIRSCKMYRAPQVLVLAPLEGGTGRRHCHCARDTKTAGPAVSSQWPENCSSTKRNHCDTNMSMVSIYLAPCLGHKSKSYCVGWWLPLLAIEASNSAPCSTRSICPQSHSLGGGYAAAPSPSKRELSHILGRLSPLLCQDRTALVKCVLMNWQKGAGPQLALPRSAHLHLHRTLPGCLQTADTETVLLQTIPLPQVQPPLGRTVCLHTPPPLACRPFQHKSPFHRNIQAQWQVRRDDCTYKASQIFPQP